MSSPELNFNRKHLLKRYGHEELQFAMAYGSGVFQQAGYNTEEKPMIDFVFGVKDTQLWHQENIRNNPDDYSAIRHLGSRFVRWMQEGFGAQIYYNPFVNFEEQEIKYGVISQRHLIDDLINWKTLYVSGRLHKPVHILKGDTSKESGFGNAFQQNLENAVRVALLLLPESFTEQELFMAIAGLSYTGDVRMKHGENPDKVKNIVVKNKEGFHDLYKIPLAAMSTCVTRLNEGQFQQSIDPKNQGDRINELPLNLRNQLRQVPPNISREELSQFVRAGVAEIVRGPSTSIIVKGLFTAGYAKSLRYVQEKRKKRRPA